MTPEIELVDGEKVTLRPNRAFWRYLLAGLALVVFGDIASAIQTADALLIELENGGGDAG